MATGRLPDPNSSPLTAKGDLYTYSTVPAKLAVGSNGETLVADSSASTGLRWQGNYAAGKNQVINGDFNIWQRGTSFTVASDTYTADRFLVAANGGQTMAFTRETFTPGTAPVAGYEGKFFYQYAVTAAGSGNTYNQLKTRIEGARTLAGQTATVSFWAKGSASYNITSVGYQNFGTGGSPSSAVLAWSSGNLAVTTSWQRFSYTFTMPSVSGKTFGTAGNDYIELYINMPTNQTSTTGIWGVQLEAGNTATAFQTATGTLAGELAACQRYFSTSYQNGVAVPTAGGSGGLGVMFSYPANAAAGHKLGAIYYPVRMRANPTVTIYSYTSATSNVVSDATGADLAANTGTPYLISAYSVYVYNNTANTIFHSQGGYICHFAASAEL